MKQTIQIADKPTLDEIKSLLENGGYGLEALKLLLDTVNLNVDSVKTVTKRTGIYGKINAIDDKFQVIKISKGSSGIIEIPRKIIPLLGYCVRASNIPNSYSCTATIKSNDSSGSSRSHTWSATIGYHGDNGTTGLSPFMYNAGLNKSSETIQLYLHGIYFSIPSYNSNRQLCDFPCGVRENEYLEDIVITISNPGIDTYCYFHYIELGEW